MAWYCCFPKKQEGGEGGWEGGWWSPFSVSQTLQKNKHNKDQR